MAAHARTAAGAGKRRRTAYALICAAAIGALVAQMLSSADALFLSRVGPRHLGTGFAISSAVSVVVLWGLGALADVRERASLLVTVSSIGIGVLVGVLALLATAPAFGAAIFLVAGKQVGSALELLLWLVVADRFTAREARRLVPWLVVANGAGAALGALSVGPLAAISGASAPLVSAALLCLATAVFGRLLALAPDQRLARRKSGSAWRAAAPGVVLRHPIARWLALLVASAGIFAPMLYYALSAAAASEFSSEAELAGFFGDYRGYVQLVALAAQLVAAPWLSKRLGVGLLLVIAPLGAILAASVVGMSSALWTVALAQASARVLDVAIQAPGEQLVQNLLSEELRGRVAGFVGGVAKRSGAIVGGLLASLLVVWPTAFAVALTATAALWLAIAVALWRRFPALAARSLAEPRVGQPAAVARGERRTQAMLLAKVGRTPFRDDAAVVSSLCQMAEDESSDLVSDVLQAIASEAEEYREDRLRALAFELLARGARVSPAAVAKAESLVTSTSPRRRELAAWVLSCQADPARAEALVHSVYERDAEFFCEAALARCRGENPADACYGAEAPLAALCLRTEVSLARVGRSAVSSEELAERLTRVAARLDAGSEFLAAIASVSAALEGGAESAVALVAHTRLSSLAETYWRDDEAERREAAVIALAVVGTDERRLVTMLGDRDARVRQQAARAVSQWRGEREEELYEALSIAAHSGRARLRQEALGVLGDLRPSAELLSRLLERERAEMSRCSRRARAFREGGDAPLVVRRLEERCFEAALATLGIVEATGRHAGLGIVAKRLRLATHPRSRARALEALDALLPRRLATEMLGALEGSLPAADVEEAVSEELRGTCALTRDLLVFSLGGEGRARYREAIASAAHDASKSADPTELLRRLTGAAERGTVAFDMPGSVETIAALAELPLFEDLQVSHLEALASVVRWKELAAGDVLMEAGQRASSMYFVRTGALEVRSGTRPIATLGVGEPVGELALFSEDRRSATVLALEPTQVGCVTREDIEDLIEDVPGVALKLCQAMSRRLAAGVG